jgi:hypothetical protein
LDYLSEIWVVGRNGYATISEAKKYYPEKEPKMIIYRDKTWPKPYTPEWEAGPVSYRERPLQETLRTILERCWESWEKRHGND